jgi:cytochrome bd-type quinol oxidase subunit 2
MPKTKIGKWSFWIVLLSFVSIYVTYWLSMIGLNITTPFPGFILMSFVLVFGVLSFVSLVKYKDKSILLIASSLLGLLGLAFALGELFFPH